jgi:hypothetical protein
MNSSDRPHTVSAREAEIANIEHEIMLLQERLAQIEKWARIVVWPSFALMCFVVLALGMYGLVASEMLAVGVSFVGIVFLGLMGSAIRSRRLVDFASSLHIYPERSYAFFLEKKIADRKRRLAALKAMP